jgi:hypothetical protein
MRTLKGLKFSQMSFFQNTKAPQLFLLFDDMSRDGQMIPTAND